MGRFQLTSAQYADLLALDGTDTLDFDTEQPLRRRSRSGKPVDYDTHAKRVRGTENPVVADQHRSRRARQRSRNILLNASAQDDD